MRAQVEVIEISWRKWKWVGRTFTSRRNIYDVSRLASDHRTIVRVSSYCASSRFRVYHRDYNLMRPAQITIVKKRGVRIKLILWNGVYTTKAVYKAEERKLSW